MQYDLEERTAVFGENIIDFIKTVERNEINRPLSNQIVRSATSIGANYMEANQASSKKDFTNKKPNKKSVLSLSKYRFFDAEGRRVELHPMLIESIVYQASAATVRQCPPPPQLDYITK